MISSCHQDDVDYIDLVNLCLSRSSGPPPSAALLACYLYDEDGDGKNNVDGNMISDCLQDDVDYV